MSSVGGPSGHLEKCQQSTLCGKIYMDLDVYELNRLTKTTPGHPILEHSSFHVALKAANKPVKLCLSVGQIKPLDGEWVPGPEVEFAISFVFALVVETVDPIPPNVAVVPR